MAKDVRIVPSTGIIEFKNEGISVGSITESGGNIYISTSGYVSFGDGTPANLEIGATNQSVDFTFLGGGSITAGGNTINIGVSGDTVNLAVPGVTYQYPTNLNAASLQGYVASDFAIANHFHTIANVTGLQAALDSKQAAGSYLTTTGKAADSNLLDGIDSSSFLRSDTSDIFTGSLTINGDIRGGGQQLVLNAGESYSYASGQTDEYVYVNAENGFMVSTSPDNWGSGWAGRQTTIITGASISVNGSTVWHTGNFNPGSYLGINAKAADSELLDGINSTSFLRSDAADTFTGILTGTATGENLKIGGIRGTTKGSQTGEYIHLYERVHIGGPAGWGASTHGAPTYGLSTWGSVDFGMNGTGVIQLDGTTIVTAARALTNVTNTNWDAAYSWGNHAGLYAAASHTHNIWDLPFRRSGVNVDNVGSDNLFETIRTTGTGQGTWPGSYEYLVSFGDESAGIQFVKSFGTGTKLYFRGGTDNPSSENGANTYTNWRGLWDSSDFGSTNISNWNTAYGWGNHAGLYAAASHTHNYDNYGSWNLKTNGVQRTTVTSGGNVDIVAGTNVSVSYGAGGVVTISSTDTNTTYTASTGLTLTGTAFSVTNNGIGATQLNVSGNGTTAQYLRSDGDGSFTWATPTDTNTTYSAGTGLTLSGTTFSVTANTYAASSHQHDGGDIVSGTIAAERIADLSGTYALASHSHSNYLGISAKAADSELLDGLDSTAFMRATNTNGYYGLTTPGGNTTDWIRTTAYGLIPYQSGGYSSIGTSSWPFSTIYVTTLYENGTALSSKYLGISAKASDSFNLNGSDWNTTNKIVRWSAGSGYHGNPRSMAIGYSGGNYGQFGYGIDFTATSGVHTYAIADVVTRVDLYGGLIVYGAPSGTVGTNISWTETFRARYTDSAPTFKGNVIWHAGNDGAGSGLNADLLDGIDSSSFLRSDVDNTFGDATKTLTIAGVVRSNNNGNVYGPNFNVSTTNKSTSEYAYRVDRSGTVVGGITIGGQGVFADGLTVGTASFSASTINNWNTAYGWGDHGSAGYITSSGSISGNAATATKLATARSIALSGDVTGSANFDGSGNIIISATVADNSHSHSNYAPLASPALTGTPTAPTASAATNTTQIATTAFVKTAISDLVSSAPAALDTLNELAAALGNDANFSTTITTALGGKLGNSGQQQLGKTAHAPGTGSYHLELYSPDTGDSNNEISMRFHQGNRYWGQLRYRNGAFRITGGADDIVATMYANIVGNVTGNATTATTLATARTLTIGSTGKAFNGSANVSWTLAEIGAQPAGSYLTSVPAATSTAIGGVELFSDTVQTVAANAVTATASRTYGVQLNSAGQAVVNVPWVDTNTNTTYSAGTGLTLSGTTFSVTANTYAAASHTHSAGDITSGTLDAARLPRPVSGDWWNSGAIVVGNDGVMEVGKYMDWHETDAGTSDYDYRMYVTSGRMYMSGDLEIDGGDLYLNDGNTRLHEGTGNSLKITTDSGWVELAPMNTAHCHIQTDRSNFYFNTELRVDTGIIGSYNEDLQLRRAGSNKIYVSDDTTTSYNHFVPDTDRIRTLGTDALRWQIIFCETLDSAGLHEANLASKKTGFYATGTVLVWKDGEAVPCTDFADHMKIGIAVYGNPSPLVQGAEPVLCTGQVREGDYLVTSQTEGHAVAMSRKEVKEQDIMDCVIGKALESGNGESHLIKTWVNI